MNIFFWLILNVSLNLFSKTEGQTRPHIVFCLIDDLGWNDVSFHGSLQIPTPNIDTLAANGIVLHNYYTQPLCTPSRASLMTGIHPIEYGLQYGVLKAAQPAGLSLKYKLFPQYMKSLGYKTHAIGKWHLGFHHKEYTPVYRGFDSFFGFWIAKQDYYTHVGTEPSGNLGDLSGRVLRRNMEYADEYNGTYSTGLFTKEAIKVIREHDGSQPLFLYLSHQALHDVSANVVYQAPKKYINQFWCIQNTTRRALAGMAAAMDESIGKVFRALHKKRILSNTIFILSTDNGGAAAGYGGLGSNWPLRGNKGTTWEGGVRGTALIWSPLIRKSPRISTQLMSIHDWLPTLYYAAGGDPADLGNIYGQNMWKAILDDTPSPRTELLHNIDPVENVKTVRKGDYKLVIENYVDNEYSGWYGPSGRDNGISEEDYNTRLDECWVTKMLKKMGNYKSVKNEWLAELNITCNLPQNYPKGCDSLKTPCLFNVITDPCEERDISNENPKIVTELLALLQMYNETAVPLVNQTFDPRADPRNFDYHWTNWADFL